MSSLIIGYGNELAGDDSLGVLFAAYFANSQERPLDCQVLCLPQLYPELAESISTADAVVFVDAGIELAPGEISFNQLDASNVETECSSTALFGHHLRPQELIAFTRVLYDKNPPAWLCTVGVWSTKVGILTSPFVKAQLPVIKDLILLKLREYDQIAAGGVRKTC